ncbi:MAG: DUF945 domain-containing protein [Candidimonas sp.]|nr:MAG: DUF945 domain-containing protein [Candidimonas sp.]
MSVRDARGAVAEFKLADHIEHGPFPLSRVEKGKLRPLMVISHAQLLPTATTQPWFEARVDKTHAPVYADTLLGLGGSGRSVWTAQPFAVAGSGIVFSGGRVTADLSNQFHDNAIAGNFRDVGLTNADGALHAHDVRIASTTAVSPAGVTTSKSTITVAKLAYDSGSGPTLAIDDWLLSLSGARTGHLLDGMARYRFGHIQSGSSDLGSLSIDAKVSHLDVPALDALNDAYQRTASGASSGAADDRALRDTIVAFLATEPRISIDDFQWRTPKGTSTLTADVRLTRPAGSGAGEAPQSLLDALKEVDIDLSLSQPMVAGLIAQGGAAGGQPSAEADAEGAVRQVAARLIQAGMVREVGTQLVSHIRYQGREVDLNGEKLPVNEFLLRAALLFMS